MDEKSTSGDSGGRLPPQGEHASLHGAFELLSARQYERVEQLLLERQEAAQRSGQMALVVILAAACQLCLTCKQFHADRKLHQLGFEEAARRERESRLQIQAVLTMLSQLSLPETQAEAKTVADLPSPRSEIAGAAESFAEKQPTLLSKVKRLLGFEPIHPDDKSGAGDVRDYGESKVSPPVQVDTASALQNLAHSLEMLEEEAPATMDDLPSAEAEHEPMPGVKTDDSPVVMPEGEASPAIIPPEQSDEPAFSAESSPLRSEKVGAHEDVSLPSLVTQCLGPFRVYQNGELISEWNGLMGQRILKYMVAHHGRSVSKEVLMEVMWANVRQEAARRNLHQAIYSLRQTLRRRDPDITHILFENDHYLLNPAIDIWIDFLEFERNAQEGQRLEAAGELEAAFEVYGVAEALYQGTFLEEDLYEEWANSQRDYLHNLYLDIADRLSEHFLNRGNYVATIALCQKALGHEPSFEVAHRRIMHCYLAQGQRYLAMRQYQTCVQIMKEELDLGPSEETEALFQRINAEW